MGGPPFVGVVPKYGAVEHIVRPGSESSPWPPQAGESYCGRSLTIAPLTGRRRRACRICLQAQLAHFGRLLRAVQRSERLAFGAAAGAERSLGVAD